MHYQAAALLLGLGLSPQDFERLADEFDLLEVSTGVLHDPQSAARDLEHLEQVFAGPLAWLPGAEPFGDLWRELRVGPQAAAVRLCPLCFKPT